MVERLPEYLIAQINIVTYINKEIHSKLFRLLHDLDIQSNQNIFYKKEVRQIQATVLKLYEILGEDDSLYVSETLQKQDNLDDLFEDSVQDGFETIKCLNKQSEKLLAKLDFLQDSYDQSISEMEKISNKMNLIRSQLALLFKIQLNFLSDLFRNKILEKFGILVR